MSVLLGPFFFGFEQIDLKNAQRLGKKDCWLVRKKNYWLTPHLGFQAETRHELEPKHKKKQKNHQL